MKGAYTSDWFAPNEKYLSNAFGSTELIRYHYLDQSGEATDHTCGSSDDWHVIVVHLLMC